MVVNTFHKQIIPHKIGLSSCSGTVQFASPGYEVYSSLMAPCSSSNVVCCNEARSRDCASSTINIALWTSPIWSIVKPTRQTRILKLRCDFQICLPHRLIVTTTRVKVHFGRQVTMYVTDRKRCDRQKFENVRFRSTMIRLIG